MNDKIAKKLKELPEKSGVYIMRDVRGDIIYVGKAVLLTRRVRQYFGSSPKPVKVQAMADSVDDFDYIITLTEKDALALEANLIRKYKPRYNILLKDDKHSPYIRIDLKADFPCVEITRKTRRDGARYYGPFFNGVRAHELVDVIRSCYKVRTCRGKLKKRDRACLNYDMGLCDAPCMGYVTADEYRENVGRVLKFLSGYDDGAEKILSDKMANAAANEQFERAIEYRDKLGMLKKLRERTVANLGTVTDLDAYAYAFDGRRGVVSVAVVRGNKLIGVKNYSVSDGSIDAGDSLSTFMAQYYDGAELPQEICLPESADVTALGELFASEGRKVEFVVPQKGTRRRLVETAASNAADYLEKNGKKADVEYDMTEGACRSLADILGIKSAWRMECYDISNVSGVDKVASQATFIGGKPSPKDYRRYKIKTVEGSDDFRCMEEVIRRRLRRSKDDEKFAYLPDLIVIDGGKGQLRFAYEVMQSEGFDVPMVGLAKREEEIFTPHSPEPIVLPHSHYALRLMQRIRDEAHRFAITYHRKLRGRRYFSELDEVKGIGEKKRALLLKAFPSPADIRSASVDTLTAVGLDERTARAVYEHFHKEKDE